MEKVITTGYRTNTPNHFLVDSGALYKNLQWTTAGGWQGEPIGATSGGTDVNIEQEYREPEIDGVMSSAVGIRMLTSSNMSMTIRVKEFTAEAIRMGINGRIEKGDGTTAPSSATIVTGKGEIENSDYMRNVGLVGRLSGSSDPVIVILDNVLSTEGVSFTTEDDNEAVIEMTLSAHADAGQVADRSLPGRIIFPQINVVPRV